MVFLGTDGMALRSRAALVVGIGVLYVRRASTPCGGVGGKEGVVLGHTWNFVEFSKEKMKRKGVWWKDRDTLGGGSFLPSCIGSGREALVLARQRPDTDGGGGCGGILSMGLVHLGGWVVSSRAFRSGCPFISCTE